MATLVVNEIFFSLQGETSHSGLPYAFVRLTGCDLRCTYCDTSYGFAGGKARSVGEIAETVSAFPTRNVLITGGEPLLQKNLPELLAELDRRGFQVSIETHGEAPIESVVGRARIVLDVKTPGSGVNGGLFRRNLPLLKPGDAVKFVITSPEDYLFARALVREPEFPKCEILFSPAVPADGQPGQFTGVTPQWLAERILEDGLPVRFQLQLHKQIWGSDARGK
jgi:7-carboxy-7-deazaguanine synthase